MKEFRVYKPNRQNKGSALKVQFRVKPKNKESSFAEAMLFLEVAEQTGLDGKGNAQFDWMGTEKYNGRSCTMKLGVPDVAEILLVLHTEKLYAGPPPKGDGNVGPGLFHKNQNGNTVLKFQGYGDKLKSYAVQLSTSKDNSFRISLTAGEGMILRILLEEFIRQYYGWIDSLD